MISEFPCCENKGADQLCSYCTADLRLCFRMYANCWFSHAQAHFICRTVRVWLKRDTGQYWPSICHNMPCKCRFKLELHIIINWDSPFSF